MNDELRQRVIETLRRGEELPAEWARELFPPEKREYELVYFGKERDEDILASTMAVPLQPVRSFGKTGEDWENMLILGDNLQVLKRLWEEKKAGRLVNADGTPGVRLIYIDPPFATKQDFRGGQDEKAYRDKIVGAQFVEFLRKRLVLLRELLSADGCIYLHLDYRKIHYAKVVLDEIFGENNLINEIIWQRTASHNDPGRYGAVHDTILFYRKGATYTWNEPKTDQSQEYLDRFFVYAESPDKQQWVKLAKGEEAPSGWERFRLGNLASPNPRPNLIYDYKGYPPPKKGWKVSPDRMEEMDRQGLLHFPASRKGRIQSKQYLKDTIGNKAVSDVWLGISPLQGQSAEKHNYPTQKPEALLSRIIGASSNPGDIVLDCFAGSGTTLAVAERMNRRWIGIDRGKLATYTIQRRLLNLKSGTGNKGKRIAVKPFVLYNAGLYDFSTLQQLPWQDWRFFALQLFECKDDPHVIGGMQLDGKRKGASVLVFNHHEFQGQRIDEETIYSIHVRIGDKIGSRFFIIAPRNVFDFQQDFIDFDNVRYYALRIPYSFINELHRREFTSLQQPKDELAINDLVDTEGFDFIQPPAVKWTAGVEKSEDKLFGDAFIRIDRFESRAQVRGNVVRGELETFSMLLLDFDYHGEVFNLDACYFANQLSKDDWYAKFSPDQIGAQIMAIFMDIYGNEAVEVISRDDFNFPNL